MVQQAARGVTSERDVLLATKLNVPGLRPGLMPRPRLAQRLDEGLGLGLVLACAPTGCGKTVLFTEWVRHGRMRWPGCRWMLATTIRPGSGGMRRRSAAQAEM